MGIRAAAVGLGWWGGILGQAAGDSGEVDLVTCFARSAESREQYAQRFGCRTADSFEAVLDDPEVEALIVATPHSLHLEMIEAAADAGKHVFVEKPLTLTVPDARACHAAAERAGIVLQVGHHRRRSASNRRVKHLVDDGSLGLVHQLEATFNVPKYQQPLTTWRGDRAESPAGGMTGLGVHMVDTMHYLVGPTKRVTAYSKRILGRWDIDDATAVAFEFESGPLGVLTTSLVLPKRCDISVHGTEAIAWSEEDGTRVFRQRKDQGSREEEQVEPLDPLADQMVEFAACVRNGDRPETGGPEAIAVVAVLQGIVMSVESGCSVDIADVG